MTDTNGHADRWAGVIRPGMGRITVQREKAEKIGVFDRDGTLLSKMRVVSLNDLVPRLAVLVLERGLMSPERLIRRLGLRLGPVSEAEEGT